MAQLKTLRLNKSSLREREREGKVRDRERDRERERDQNFKLLRKSKDLGLLRIPAESSYTPAPSVTTVKTAVTNIIMMTTTGDNDNK